MTTGTAPVVLAALGNEYRRDDGAGLVVAAAAARLLRGVGYLGPLPEPFELWGRWDRARAAVIVDAVRSGAAPGTVHVIEVADEGPRRVVPGGTSTHGFGLPDVLRLGRVLGRAPGRVVLIGMEGDDFGPGRGLTPIVEAAVPLAVTRVLGIVEELVTCA
jgi:hydrogenase maturation protease